MKIEEKKGKFVITEFNELEAYKIARKIEKDGIWFYSGLADRINNEKIKETLRFLASEEKKHLKLFEGFLVGLRQTTQDNFEEDDLFDSMEYGVFMPYKNIEDLDKALTSPKKALRLGVIVEDKSIKLYSFCLRKNPSSAVAAELKKIIEEEKRHKALLKSMLRDIS